jgi:hypothetical protein
MKDVPQSASKVSERLFFFEHLNRCVEVLPDDIHGANVPHTLSEYALSNPTLLLDSALDTRTNSTPARDNGSAYRSISHRSCSRGEGQLHLVEEGTAVCPDCHAQHHGAATAETRLSDGRMFGGHMRDGS